MKVLARALSGGGERGEGEGSGGGGIGREKVAARLVHGTKENKRDTHIDIPLQRRSVDES